MSAIVGIESKGSTTFTLTQLPKYIFDEYACHRSHDNGNFQDLIYLTLQSAVQHGFLVSSEDFYSRDEFQMENFPIDILTTEKASNERKRLQTRCLMKRLKAKDGQTVEELCEPDESLSIIRKSLEMGVHLGFIGSDNHARRGKLYFRNVRKPDRGMICAPNYSFCSTMVSTASKASSI